MPVDRGMNSINRLTKTVMWSTIWLMKEYHKSNYVAPAPKPRVEIIPIEEQIPMLPTAQTSVQLHTTYIDRAKGFQLATLPISIAFGVGALVVAVVGYSVPVISIGALATFWLAFLAWWLIGWTIHNVASPDGIALIHTVLMWRYLFLEGRERRRHYARLRARDGADK